MKLNRLAVVISSLLIVGPLTAQQYNVGDIVQDQYFTNYQTGETDSLYDLGSQGGVLVLEWFAWWCPFCSQAAANVEQGIINYYAGRGNIHGVPVRHIALNVQGGARPQSDTFIQTYGYQTIMEDYDRDFFRRFQNSSGQPLFVVINAEPNSPSAEQWEVLNIWFTYGTNPDISSGLRPFIDSILPGTLPDPVLEAFAGIPDPINGWYSSDWFGEFHGDAFPWIYHYELGYGYVIDGPGDAIYFWNQLFGWISTDPTVFPFVYSSDTNDWGYLMVQADELWFFDYNTQSWLRFP